MNVAVIVAAGSGTRFGGDTPKIFLDLKGIPVIVRSIRAFEGCAGVESIVVVVSPPYVERMKEIVAEFGLRKVGAVVGGADSRSGSVRNGVGALDASKTKLVLIHDGARPLVSVTDIEATMKMATVTGAAVLTVPVTDTVKEVRGGRIVRTVDRETLRRAVTPQVFNLEILLAAIASGPDDESITDESLLVERAGFEVAAVDGDLSNIKITHPSDMVMAAALMGAEVEK